MEYSWQPLNCWSPGCNQKTRDKVRDEKGQNGWRPSWNLGVPEQEGNTRGTSEEATIPILIEGSEGTAFQYQKSIPWCLYFGTLKYLKCTPKKYFIGC